MARNEQLKCPQEKKLRNFHEKLNLKETALPQQQRTDFQWQWQLLKNQCHAAAHEGVGNGKAQIQYSEVPVRIEKKHKDHHDKEAQIDAEKTPQAKPIDGCFSHLLILAQSAEIVAQSEDSMVGVHTHNQNKG